MASSVFTACFVRNRKRYYWITALLLKLLFVIQIYFLRLVDNLLNSQPLCMGKINGVSIIPFPSRMSIMPDVISLKILEIHCIFFTTNECFFLSIMIRVMKVECHNIVWV